MSKGSSQPDILVIVAVSTMFDDIREQSIFLGKTFVRQPRTGLALFMFWYGGQAEWTANFGNNYG
ncbi:MAG: hypothetical protein GX825_00200 [Syntrophomonadaceae bacterium]|nr:hypothetical protein [Syntrophomonadaceae bacterium]